MKDHFKTPWSLPDIITKNYKNSYKIDTFRSFMNQFIPNVEVRMKSWIRFGRVQITNKRNVNLFLPTYKKVKYKIINDFLLIIDSVSSVATQVIIIL